MKDMNEAVNTRQFELLILKNKLNKLKEGIEEAMNKYKDCECKDIKELQKVLDILEQERKELVDCATLFLSFPVLGVEGCINCAKLVGQVDILSTSIRLQVLSGLV